MHTDSQYYVTDPEVQHVPVSELLSKVPPFSWSPISMNVLHCSKDYLASRAKLFNPKSTNPSVVHVNCIQSRCLSSDMV